MYSRAGKVTAYLEFEVIGAVINLSLTMENVIDEDRRNMMQRTNTELENSVNVDLFFSSMPFPISLRLSMILQLGPNISDLFDD